VLPERESSPLVECVANFSEGRDRRAIEAIAAAVAGVPGVGVLDWSADADHHRSVITFAGRPEAIGEAAVVAVGEAVARIDLTRHSGVHPRIGSADVVPFVPLRGITLVECAWLAHAVGAEIWNRYSVPVFLYDAAAQRESRRNLANVRKAAAGSPFPVPDFGEAAPHPTAGAVAVGARKILIAWNVFLADGNVAAAKEIARRIRQANGGLACVRALGLYLAGRGQAQISMNLTDYTVTPPHVVWEAIGRIAAELGVEVATSELIGLIPEAALAAAAAGGVDLRIEDFSPDRVLESRLRTIAMESSRD
jgi:glutamate formiminotransferase